VIVKHVSKPNQKAAAAHMVYITRTSACADIDFYNLDELRGADMQESRANAIAFAETRMIEEAHKKHGGSGVSKNHMRAVFSFDRKIDAAEACQFVKDFIAKELPNCRCVLATHHDTDHSHVHVYYDIRTADTGNKLQIPDAQYKTMDERYCCAYDKRFGTNYLPDHIALKSETARWKHAYAKAKAAGVSKEMLPEKPKRAADRSTGVKSHELVENRIDRNKFANAAGQQSVTNTHNQLNSGEREATRFEHEFRETLASSERLQQTIKSLDRSNERTLERTGINRELSR
jgi:hypothetical protein